MTSPSSSDPKQDRAVRQKLVSAREEAALARGQRLDDESNEICSLLDRLVAGTDSLLDFDLDPLPRQTAESIRDVCEQLASLIDGILDAPRIRIPSSPSEAIEGTATPGPSPGLRILVAEDHLVNRTIVRLMLRSLNLDADFVTNGAEAVEQADGRSYDVILMDLKMPRLGGIEAARQIRARCDDTAPQPRIVAMSAYALKPVREECQRAGIDGFLAKPIQLDELREFLTLASVSR